ncbi:hypothetical protein OBBRIDRAFT_527259 [Obba rivulosa]|uniref:Uncharacterized protein n=1 Tax=Obba rivulosa TaxID=1052685 RepID=A0A8E2B034_9APHY|nr:hypothetical protein OBBRIDRAFT_527259 [Obba rivulosa]
MSACEHGPDVCEEGTGDSSCTARTRRHFGTSVDRVVSWGGGGGDNRDKTSIFSTRGCDYPISSMVTAELRLLLWIDGSKERMVDIKSRQWKYVMQTGAGMQYVAPIRRSCTVPKEDDTLYMPRDRTFNLPICGLLNRPFTSKHGQCKVSACAFPGELAQSMRQKQISLLTVTVDGPRKTVNMFVMIGTVDKPFQPVYGTNYPGCC